MKVSIFLAYLRSVGWLITLGIIILYTFNNAAQVAANFWLSEWADDPPPINGTVDTKQRDLRLGVYGALGLSQGKVDAGILNIATLSITNDLGIIPRCAGVRSR